MIRIIADTSTLYSTAQAREAGFDVSPLSVTIAGKSYREFDEISSAEFTDIIRQGHLPVSSQPAIGEVAALYSKYPDDEILNIAMADGLSGTYRTAAAAAGMDEYGERITVLNSTTLCGPHRHLVECALRWAKEGLTMPELMRRLLEKMETHKSFLIPAVFDYLRRGGRLSPLVSYVGKAASLTPVMTQTDDGCRLTIAGIRRGFSHGIKFIVSALEKHGVTASGWKIYVVHADAPDLARQAKSTLQAAFPGCSFEIHPLSPAFITQGGPGCVAVQVIAE